MKTLESGIRRFVTLILALWACLAQETHTEFEVASVKRLTQPRNISSSRGGPGTDDPERLTWSNVTLTGLLTSAYGVRREQISGPSWMQAEHYDVAAKIPPGTTTQQMRVMMQNLLTTRFQLVLHHETRVFPVYEDGFTARRET